MILGVVRDGFPRITITLPGILDRLATEFVIDTGFDGDLALPPSVLAKLNAPLVAFGAVRMADSSERRVAIHEVLVDWDGEERTAETYALEGRPLLGSTLLQGFHLGADMTEGGEVTIEQL